MHSADVMHIVMQMADLGNGAKWAVNYDWISPARPCTLLA
jgi:hypothetical protein